MKKLIFFFLILLSITSKGQIISLVNDSGVVKTLNPFTGVKTRLNTTIPVPTGANLKWSLRANASGTYDLYDQTKDTILKVLSNSRFYFIHDNVSNVDYIESYDARLLKADSINFAGKQLKITVVTNNTGNARFLNDSTLFIPIVTNTVLNSSGGIYTPIITNVADVTSSSITQAMYSKVDSIVDIAGEFTILAATGSNTAATVDISLPFASTFTQAFQLVGNSISINGNDLSFLPLVRGNVATSKMRIIVKPTAVPQSYNYKAQYRIVSGGAAVVATQLSATTVTATNFSSSQNNLSWTAVPNRSSYLIETSPNGTTGWVQIGGAAFTATTYSHTGLAASTIFYYRITAQGDGTNFTNSGYGFANATTAAASTTQLATPTLTSTAASNTVINLSWTASTNSSSYLLETSANGSTAWSQIGGTLTALTYSHTALTPATQYFYRITAVSSNASFTNSTYGISNATTQVTPTAGTQRIYINLSKTNQAIGNNWNNVFGLPAQAVVTANNLIDTTGAATTIGITSVATGNWAPYASNPVNCANDTATMTSVLQGTFFNAASATRAVYASNWYTVGTIQPARFDTTKPMFRFTGLTPSASYTILTTSVQGSSGFSAFGTARVVGLTSPLPQEINGNTTIQNTGATFTLQSKADGTIDMWVNTSTTAGGDLAMIPAIWIIKN